MLFWASPVNWNSLGVQFPNCRAHSGVLNFVSGNSNGFSRLNWVQLGYTSPIQVEIVTELNLTTSQVSCQTTIVGWCWFQSFWQLIRHIVATKGLTQWRQWNCSSPPSARSSPWAPWLGRLLAVLLLTTSEGGAWVPWTLDSLFLSN